MNILVVGGAGYIGSHVCRILKNTGYNVSILDNSSTGNNQPTHEYRTCFNDLLNIKKSIWSNRDCPIYKFFEINKFSAVIHLAACSVVSESFKDPLGYYENNVTGTLNLLKMMKEFKIKNLIFSSTCAVYGIPDKLPITINESYKPISPYGKSKLMVEQILRSSGINFTILRYFNAAGSDLTIGESRRNETHLIPLAIQALLKDEPFKLYGTDYPTKDGTCVRDYVHVNDLGDCHILALKWLLEGKGNLSVNLGSGAGYTNFEILNKIESQVGKKFKEIECLPRREGDPASLYADYTWAKETLEWEPKRDIDKIISDAIYWEKNRTY